MEDNQRNDSKVSIKKREKSKYQPRQKAVVSIEVFIEKGKSQASARNM